MLVAADVVLAFATDIVAVGIGSPSGACTWD
jgi:hypothetical protein